MNSGVSTPVAADADPLGAAVAAGIAAGRGRRKLNAQVRAEARAIRAEARASAARAAAVGPLLALVREYPSAEFLQKIVARLFHEMADDTRAIAAWRGIITRFPTSPDAFRNLVMLVSRHEGPEAARPIIAGRFSVMPNSFEELVIYADACDRAGLREDADRAFNRLTELLQRRRGSWLSAASWLEGRGRYRFTGKLLRRAAGWTGFARPMTGEGHYVESMLDDFGGSVPEGNVPALGSRQPSIVSTKVLESLFHRAIEERSHHKRQLAGHASVVMITGSLGCGGAERQLANTAIGLTELNGATCHGHSLGAVTIVSRSLTSRPDGKHFVPVLQRSGIGIKDYQELPDFGGNLRKSAARPLLTALRFLPWAVAEGVVKLTDTLRALDPAVVHIWQDGMVYATGLAALLAGTPRIVLSARSVPPPDRPRRYLPEYDLIYKSMLSAPGVTLSVNSRHAADRYADWLGMERDTIEVVRNGVCPPDEEGDPAAHQSFRDFAARTQNCRFTLGTIMRMDNNKRPLFWIEVAARFLSLMPEARFVVVGDGPLRTKMMRRAEALNIAGRCLFVGRSDHVGYWLSQMDAFMLTSEHEGLPNALIEAQLTSLPVITTPAGGALEAVVPDVTGIVISHSAKPDEVASRILDLASKPDRLRTMGVAAEQWAKTTFPISRMIERTLQVYFPETRLGPTAAEFEAMAADIPRHRVTPL